MDETSARDRYTEMLQQRYASDVIREAPDLEPGDEHPSVVEVQNCLKRFGYLDAVAEGRTHEPGRLDEVTVDALTAYQRFYKLTIAELGKVAPGTLDAPTRELMATPVTCGMPDVLPGEIPPGPAFRYKILCPWDRRFFTYGFGNRTGDVGYLAQTWAVRRAFQTWAAAGVGLSFGRVYTDPWQDPDFLVRWRPVVDPPDVDLTGWGAFADYPPCLTGSTRPKHLRLNDSDYTWVIGQAPSWTHPPYGDIETTILHEVGHLLGLDHTGVPGNIMLNKIGTQHTVGADDLAGLRALYPPALPTKNRITSVNSGKVLDVWEGRQENGTQIVQWDWSGDAHQRFRVEHAYDPIGDPAGYRLVAEHSGKVLTVEGESTANKALIRQHDWENKPNQRFWVQPFGNPGDGYHIVAQHSGKVLDVLAYSTDPGAHIVQWDRDPLGARNQLWRFD